MARFRKKPVEIEAVQMPEDADPGNFAMSPQWVHEALGDGTLTPADEGAWFVKTLEGTMLASPGDFIIRGIAGELYPCKPDIFEQTYEAV